jgi:hypothetical protein
MTQEIDNLIFQLRELKKEINKRDKLSDKAFNMTPQTHSRSQINKASTDLNWSCMDIDKMKVKFARTFKDSQLNVSTEEVEYNPSGFHSYKY